MQYILWQDCSTIRFDCMKRAEQRLLLKQFTSQLCLSNHQPLFFSFFLSFWWSVHSLLNVILPLRVRPIPYWSSPLLYCLLTAGFIYIYIFFFCCYVTTWSAFPATIHVESSNITLYPSMARSGDNYKRGIWTCNIFRFAWSPSRMIVMFTVSLCHVWSQLWRY